MIKDLLAELKISFGVGQEYFYFLRYPVILAIALKVYFPNATIVTLGLIVLTIVNLFILLGMFDLSWIRFHQRVAEISTEKYNPYFNKLKKGVDKRKI
jgi:hypothetical protein